MNLDIWYPVITDLLIRKYGWTNQTIARISTLELRHRSPSWNMGYSWSSMKFWTNALLTSRNLNKESWFRCSPILGNSGLGCTYYDRFIFHAFDPNPVVCHSFSTKKTLLTWPQMGYPPIVLLEKPTCCWWNPINTQLICRRILMSHIYICIICVSY
jgi:hypothetical protein